MSALERALVEGLAPQVASSIKVKDLQGATEFITALIRENNPSLDITINKGVAVRLDGCHAVFKTVMKHLQTSEPVLLTGPAGSGKSTIAEHAAKALKREFGSISVCAQTTKSDFLGYMDAHGNYSPTLFRKIYENGGLFLIDEIDAGNPNVLAVLNAALSGSNFAFPDKIVTKHADFLLISTANTVGKGSTEYVGRNHLDAATLDRFNFIFVDYDTNLERALVPEKYIFALTKIYKIREYIATKKMNIIVSTRSIIKIVKLLETGLDFGDAVNATLFKCTDKDTVLAISKGVQGAA